MTVTATRSSSPAVVPHAVSAAELEERLSTNSRAGLSSGEAAERLERFGPNRLRRPRRPAYVRIALRQVLDPLVLLLIAATAVSVAVGETAEGVAIAAVVVLNAVIGFTQEIAAERAVVALAASFDLTAVVIRDGVEREVPATDVVPGDLLVLRAGDRVAADARLVATSSLEVDESALTGESLPVAKRLQVAAPETTLAERTAMVHAGTAVTRGSGRALVVATGRETELGRIDTLTEEAQPPPTPLERRLASLARQMVVVGIVLTLALAAVMLARGWSLHTSFLVAVAVAVAAVPEGLAASITGALALGSRALARRGAIVRRLDAIETLGETTVICTDKTGTLTENRIRVAGVRAVAELDDREVLAAAMLASPAGVEGLADPQLIGDPIDAAVLRAGLERGVDVRELRREQLVVQDLPFTSERGRTTVVYDGPSGRRVFVKGAPEMLAARATSVPGDLAESVEGWADEGLRVLAVATATLDPDEPLGGEVDLHLRLLGAIALHDPLREAAPGAVRTARMAGIDVRMVTGDHPRTARTIARALGLRDHAVLARATPEDKLRLVERLQAQGEVVAVTGDGINDAPALRRADVGVAMGRSGTEAAREAAAVVLTDDDFATIVAAVSEGRRIGDNIKKVVAFLLSANLGEVVVFGVAVIAGLGVPMAVIQVLLVNLVTDGLPALALARDPAAAETMTTPPRRERALFDTRTWAVLGLVGLVVGVSALAAFLLGRTVDGTHGQTMAFVTVAFAELLYVFSCRSPRLPPWLLPRNWWLVGAVAGSAALVIAAVYLAPLHGSLGTVSLSASELTLALGLAALPVGVVELAKAFSRRSHKGRVPSRRRS